MQPLDHPIHLINETRLSLAWWVKSLALNLGWYTSSQCFGKSFGLDAGLLHWGGILHILAVQETKSSEEDGHLISILDLVCEVI